MNRPGERSSNFFLAFLFLPKDKREALSAVYAYCRSIDDIADSGRLSQEEASRMLEFWRAEITRLFDGTPTHSTAAGLLPHIRRFQLPQEPFLEMIRGCSMDLEGRRYQTVEELESYMAAVASSVGALCVRIFGCQATSPEKAGEFAKLFGYAFQLTNIIRDVGEDLERGRVYIPAEDMKQAGYSERSLLLREHNEAFERLMDILYGRAKTYYRRARNLVDFRDRPALLPAEIMAHVYEGLLDHMKENGFRVLFGRYRLPAWRKVLAAGQAWLFCHGIHL